MNGTALTFLLVSAAGVMLLPRRWAPIPLLASCLYMTTSQGVEIGPFSFPVFRIILAVGLLRVILRRESIAGGTNAIDRLIVVWGAWVILASFFHEWIPGSGPVYASGFVFNIGLVYFLVRVWCFDLSELGTMLSIVAWLLVPVALAMIAEHVVEKNAFAVFGGIPEFVAIRDGGIRAQGPFSHPILAGIAGAVCAPLMIGIWQRYRLSALVGLSACTAMVIASTSSTPLMSLLLGIGAAGAWRFRGGLRAVRWAFVGAYICAEFLMTRPAYYLMSKVDFTGSSTGWYRSRLIQSAFEHLSDWWVFGTDDTGSWMYPPIDEKHSDITNYYLYHGIIGGLPAMLLLIAMIWFAFVWIGRGVRASSPVPPEQRFMVWCLGAGLLAHTASSLAVAYFDQTVIFFWLNVGAISAMWSVTKAGASAANAPSEDARVRILAARNSMMNARMAR